MYQGVIDVLPALKDGDSNFLRATSCPEAEDIPGRIHVPVVEYTTLHGVMVISGVWKQAEGVAYPVG